MSTPKRYTLVQLGTNHWMHEPGNRLEPAPAGVYIAESDYAALVQQGIRDHGDWRSKLNFLETDYKAEVARLTAENERLLKAGDAMADTRNKPTTLSEFGHLAMAWFAAKEGRDAK